jgi:hypothetical protein
VLVIGIDGLDEGGFAEEESYFPEVIELGLKFIVGEDCKIGCDDVEVGTGLKLTTEKVADGATEVVIANA